MATEKKTSKIKKKWYKIIAPSEFNDTLIGETPSYDPNLIVGKVVTVNLTNLTRDIKKQNVIMAFKVTGLKDNQAVTEPVSYKTISAFIKRIIRRSRENIHDSFLCLTSDEKKVRIKPLVITVNKTKGVVVKSIIKNIREGLKDYIRKITYNELVNELVSHSLQGNMKKKLSKIYPLRSFEIKEMKIVEKDEKRVKKDDRRVINKQKESKAGKKEEKQKETPEEKKEEGSLKSKDKENNSSKKDKEKE